MSTRDAAIDRLVAAAGRKHDTLAVGTFADGESTFRGSKMTEPLFEIGSITKPFTGVLLADMTVAGEVNLDHPVTNYLPDNALPRWKERPPTLGELATHRAALPNAPHELGRKELAYGFGLRRADPWAGVDEARYQELVRRTEAKAPPGRRFAYSSLGYGLLGDALAALAGKPYEALLRERIGTPLGLERPHHRSGRPEAAAGALQARTTAAAPARPHGRRRRDPSNGSRRPELPHRHGWRLRQRRRGARSRLAIEPRSEASKRIALGLGWMILQRKGKPDLVWHSGGTWGFRSFAAASVETGIAVVALTNTTRSVDRLGLKITDILSSLEAV